MSKLKKTTNEPVPRNCPDCNPVNFNCNPVISNCTCKPVSTFVCDCQSVKPVPKPFDVNSKRL